MKHLPTETLILIANELDLDSLKSFALISKQFLAIFNTIELQYKYWLEIYNQCDRSSNNPDAMQHRLNKVKNLQHNLNNFKVQQHHVLVRDPQAAFQANTDPTRELPYNSPLGFSNLRVLRDGYLLISTRAGMFELYKLPVSNGASNDSPESVQPMYPSVVRFRIGDIDSTKSLESGLGDWQVQDYDLDVENDLIVCCVKHFQRPHSRTQFYFHFFSLSRAFNDQQAVQHPLASEPFTHTLLEASSVASFQLQLNGPHLLVQFNERDKDSTVSVWDWTNHMALEAVYNEDVNLCEAAAFLTSDIIALAIVRVKSGGPLIQCVQIDPAQQRAVEQRYTNGLPDKTNPEDIETAGFKILSEFHIFDDSTDIRRHVPFIFAEPVVSHTTDASLRNRGSIQPTEESGFLCIEVASSDYLSNDIYPATFIVQKKRLLDNLVERSIKDAQHSRSFPLETDEKGGVFQPEFLAGVTRVVNEPKSVYPMYGTRFCNVPKVNMLELMDFNPRLKMSKPDDLNADEKVLDGGRLRRLQRYMHSHEQGTLVNTHTGDQDAMITQIAERVRQYVADEDNPRVDPIELMHDTIADENRRYLAHIARLPEGNNTRGEEVDNDHDNEDNEGNDIEEDEDEDEYDEEDEDEDDDDDHHFNVMQEIDISDVSDEEERNMGHLAPSQRQPAVAGSKQSINVTSTQRVYKDKDGDDNYGEFHLPYRTVLTFTDLGVESAMIDKECIVLETYNPVNTVFHVLTF
ncbi:hypothetical protein E3P99_02233 [Wallemia hederae]|uniref:F-box domain-containing protein n=1 Tax=Wallemia hederae TaxID=1540922 RepID=A0A4T0FMV7_9BASI|nr:hypothetical protein E3P99_02233 [Wallemia hederae]